MLGLTSFFFVLTAVAGSAIHPSDRNGLHSDDVWMNVLHSKEAEWETTNLDKAFDSDDYSEDVLFYLENIDAPQRLINNATNITQSYFNASRETKVLIHGWLDGTEKDMIQENKNAFLANYDFNVLAVDWSAIASDPLYFPILEKVPHVGKFVGEFVAFLVTELSVNASDVHIIGHSLGAQVSGFAGKAVQANGYNVSRISGLDPAWPGYYFAGDDSRLAASDADYVDVIHTSAYFAGFPTDIGQVDFFPNGGVHPQPGCDVWDISCSHKRAFRYYAASINASNEFSARPCKSVSLGLPLDCTTGNGDARMGFPANKQEDLGVYYLKTKSVSPYAEE